MQNERDRKMGNGIIVYALETCDKCNTLRDKLNQNGIQYQYINIDKNNELGDKLEDVYKCTSYPMVLINKVGYTMFLPYTSLPITPNIKIYNSIAELIEMIKQ
jgi:glutaredoxin